MNVDNEDESKPPHDDGAEVVPQTLMTLVGEEGLESESYFIHYHSKFLNIYDQDTKSNFIRIRSQHVYCLSPTPLVVCWGHVYCYCGLNIHHSHKDPSLIRAPSAQVYAVDCSLPADKAVLLGRITGPHVTVGV